MPTPSLVLLLLLLALRTPHAEAEFLGCNYSLFFEPSMTSLAIKKFYNNTRGREQWPKQFTRGWETDEPCAWNNDEKAHPAPAGLRCVNGSGHFLPPVSDGGLLFLEHYSGEAEGEIPREFKAFQMTSSIGLSFNKLNGTIWDTSYHCFMQKLDLAHNRLSGSLPDDFMARNVHAEIINLAHNKLSGTLPRSLSTLKSLVVLLLEHNRFSGEIPDLVLLQKLRHISLGHNNFSGHLGPWVSQMANLGWLELQHNNLEGSLPELPGKITRVDFAGNNFSGCVPKSYSRLGYMRHFNCTGCNLTCPQHDLLSHLRYSSHCKGY
ncbi:Leucine-rich repeat transmembrane protein kinase [Trypanosoma rangeli]|uniref:Leucine-rich repeat transmembrane protein kinase n=1 Tax=Trypanosoma rangeli TaxID=5698 RepID=A0A422NUB2_TRYRA|nr:Leucine-rich repeat transmembrane protein kinase [Trypanosoma rangeli]RNF09039.1 Leucine-rich repeat transmembrane protein kinase [Trypanosoma rangeli]|eukprot:RNF09039.1 Leucine-rich repeat transmembrane protein kinase [Trypanosoma rangeli]